MGLEEFKNSRLEHEVRKNEKEIMEKVKKLKEGQDTPDVEPLPASYYGVPDSNEVKASQIWANIAAEIKRIVNKL